MPSLEMIDASNWEAFTQSSVAVLMLGKSDCSKCDAWTKELTEFLSSDDEFAHVRFGKLLLDTPGLIAFKKANPWLAEVDVLPFNVIYVAGERVKTFAGSGLDRLRNRLRKVAEAPA
ncbi:MAG: hypothetical protein JSV80_00560 [Acidobacteriota bacterium]|nr:MAG: hypothetical protein JSV80_00560 [Acidobacteriota bacterium]